MPVPDDDVPRRSFGRRSKATDTSINELLFEPSIGTVGVGGDWRVGEREESSSIEEGDDTACDEGTVSKAADSAVFSELVRVLGVSNLDWKDSEVGDGEGLPRGF